MTKHDSNLQPLVPAASPFAALASDPNALPEIEVAILVDTLLNPELDPQSTRIALAELQNLAREHPDAQSQPWLALTDLGFTGNAAAYEASTNSSLSWVLTHRCGIPISLAVVLIAVARGVGCDAHGLNHPGHFLVRINHSLVDPFRMALVPPDTQMFSDAEQAANATPADIALRMLNNLKYASLQDQQWVAALNLLDHQLAMRPQAWDLWFEKASMWQQLGSHSSAELICRALLGEELPPALAARVETRLEHLQGRPPEVLH